MESVAARLCMVVSSVVRCWRNAANVVAVAGDHRRSEQNARGYPRLVLGHRDSWLPPGISAIGSGVARDTRDRRRSRSKMCSAERYGEATPPACHGHEDRVPSLPVFVNAGERASGNPPRRPDRLHKIEHAGVRVLKNLPAVGQDGECFAVEREKLIEVGLVSSRPGKALKITMHVLITRRRRSISTPSAPIHLPDPYVNHRCARDTKPRAPVQWHDIPGERFQIDLVGEKHR